MLVLIGSLYFGSSLLQYFLSQNSFPGCTPHLSITVTCILIFHAERSILYTCKEQSLARRHIVDIVIQYWNVNPYSHLLLLLLLLLLILALILHVTKLIGTLMTA